MNAIDVSSVRAVKNYLKSYHSYPDGQNIMHVILNNPKSTNDVIQYLINHEYVIYLGDKDIFGKYPIDYAGTNNNISDDMFYEIQRRCPNWVLNDLSDGEEEDENDI